MKKILTILMILLVSISLTACDLLPITDDPVTVSITIDYQTEDIDNKVVEIDLSNPTFNEPDPEREGFVFDGWYSDQEYSEEFTVDDILSADITIYAKWIGVRNEIAFSIDGDITYEMYTPGDTITFPTVPDKAGYTFNGWLQQDGTNFTPFTATTAPNTAIYLVANYVPNDYTITFRIGDETWTSEVVVPYNEPITNDLIPTPPVITGYEFLRWNPIIPAAMPSENITITAVYALSSYTVNFYSKGTLLETTNYKTGETIAFPNVTLEDCEVFNGWYTDLNFNTPFNDDTMPSNDLDLYAKIDIDDNCSTFVFNISLNHTNPITDNLTLPMTYQGHSVSWLSSNQMILSNTGMINRPLNRDGNQTSTLTASVAVDGELYSKSFEIVVKEQDPPAYLGVSDLVNNTSPGDTVTFTGVVSGIMTSGYFLSDGTDAIDIYSPGFTANLQLGDTVTVTGEFDKYNTTYQIKESIYENVDAIGGVNPLSPTVMSIEDLLMIDHFVNPLTAGTWYTITGTVELDQTSGKVYLVDGVNKVMISQYILLESSNAVLAKEGRLIQIDVFYFVDHSRDGVIVSFMGGEDDIIDLSPSDASILDLDEEALRELIPEVSTSDIQLPGFGPNGTTYTLWNSSNDQRFLNNGIFVNQGLTTEVVTFTVTLTYGSETRQIEIDVIVPIDTSIAEVKELSHNEYYEVTGVVYLEQYHGIYIWDSISEQYLYLFTSDMQSDVEPGDRVSILGKKVNDFNTVVSYIVTSSSNALPTPISSNVESVYNDVFQPGVPVTLTGLVSIEGDNNDVYIQGVSGLKIKVNYQSNAAEFVGLEGDTVTVTIYPHIDETVLFNGTSLDITVETSPYTPTDLEVAQADIDWIDLGDVTNVYQNLNLPSTGPNGSTFIWTSETPSRIEDDGTVHLLMGYTPTITLHVFSTYNFESLHKVFNITLNDGSALTVKTVTEAKAETDNSSVLVEGVVSGMGSFNRVFIQDSNGSAIMVEFEDPELVTIGDKVQVFGIIDTYDMGGNVQRLIEDANLTNIVSSGNSVYVDNTITHSEIVNIANQEVYSSQRYEMVLEVKTVQNENGYTEFVGHGDTDIVWRTSDHPYFTYLYNVGDTITVSFNYYNTYYSDIRIEAVTLPDLTDEQVISVTQHLLDVPEGAIWNFALPRNNLYGGIINWQSNNPAIAFVPISGDWMEAQVTRPTHGQSDLTVTIIATIGAGTATPINVNYQVLILAETYRTDAAQLFISEYGDGSSTNDYIEIYNPTNQTIDLSNYTLRIYPDSDIFNPREIELSGTIESGETFVITRNTAYDTVLTTASDMSSNLLRWTGNDVIDLLYKDILLDRLGDFTYYADWGLSNTLVRKETYVSGIVNYNSSEWTVNEPTFTYVDSHTCDKPIS